MKKFSSFLFAISIVLLCSISNAEKLEEKAVLEAVAKGLDYFKEIQLTDGAISENEYRKFDIWETINALKAIALWKSVVNIDDSAMIRKAFEFLSKHEKPNGMVLQKSFRTDSFCLETSAEYIWILLDYYPEKEKTIKEKLNYLKSLQTSDGYWNIQLSEIPESLQNSPSVTSYALNALNKGNMTADNMDAALGFLAESQQESGHWGAAWQAYGTPFYYMARVLSVVNRENSFPDRDRIISKAKEYLLKTQKNDGSWNVDYIREFFLKVRGTEGNRNYRIEKDMNKVSPELQTALALQCCFYCGLKTDSSVVSKAVDWLLLRQGKDGSWDGGNFPVPLPHTRKSEDIYATSQVLTTLYLYYEPKKKSDENK